MSRKTSGAKVERAGESKRLTTTQIWGMPVLVTVLTSIALVVGLLADGWADIIAWAGLGLPIALTLLYVGRAMRA